MGVNYSTRHCFAFISIFLLLAGVTTLIVWLVYRPSKPSFHVIGAAIYDVNTTSSYVVSTTMQFTLVAHNPNKRSAAYIDRLSAYISYREEVITAPAPLPPMFLEREGTVIMSPMLGGEPVPVSPNVPGGLVTDEAYGVVALRVVLLGRLRWKAGAFRSGHYGMFAKCDVLIGLKKGHVGEVPILGSPDCSVDV
ncbi:NDR1/HIN1-like protein 1 [Magnolia sinica]|uniref:NDR1/HIN1-like protein 1 n=1 Tax=Magnolia sinica TaxID=86752 RepID=UPI00265AEE7A|nr:NDR1/HIN1-like protein 1 [Magnolia sinica]